MPRFTKHTSNSDFTRPVVSFLVGPVSARSHPYYFQMASKFLEGVITLLGEQLQRTKVVEKSTKGRVQI